MGKQISMEIDPWKPWNVELYINHPQSLKKFKMSPNLIEILASYRFLMRYSSGIGGSTLIILKGVGEL